MMWVDDGVSGWGYAWMTLSMIVFWGLVVVGIVILVRYLRSEQPRGGPPADRPPTPEQVLADRFARGEIDEEDYRKRLDMLRAAESRVTRT